MINGDGGTGGTGESSGGGTSGTAGTAGTAGTGGTGSTTGGTAGTGGASGTGGTGGTCGGAHPAPTGRPAPVACPADSGTILVNADAGAPKCTSLADCRPDGSTIDYFYVACLHGVCSEDDCIIDSDCAAGQVCACADQLGSPIRIGNECLTTQCQVDADCGGGQVCSASIGTCNELQGYYCHTPSDECLTDTDCCGTTPLCAYQTSSGHWACQTDAVACPG